jgi:hypothetical protein
MVRHLVKLLHHALQVTGVRPLLQEVKNINVLEGHMDQGLIQIPHVLEYVGPAVLVQKALLQNARFVVLLDIFALKELVERQLHQYYALRDIIAQKDLLLQ